VSATSFEVAASAIERGAAPRDKSALLARSGIVEVEQSASPRASPRGARDTCATASAFSDDEVQPSRPPLERCATSGPPAATDALQSSPPARKLRSLVRKMSPLTEQRHYLALPPVIALRTQPRTARDQALARRPTDPCSCTARKANAARAPVSRGSRSCSAPPTRVERVTNGLGTASAIAEIAAESGDFGHFRAACLALLTAAAKRDDVGAAEALESMRKALMLDEVSRAVTLAAGVLDAASDAAGAARESA
jgi:hypothetical protein